MGMVRTEGHVMTTIRWVSFFLAALCITCLLFVERGVWSMILAALFFIFFLILCWSVGAFAGGSDNQKGTTS